MASRTASAAIALPVLLLVVWIGPPWFSILVGVAAALGALEMSNIVRKWGDRPVGAVSAAVSGGLIAGAHFLAAGSFLDPNLLPVFTVVVLLTVLELLRRAGSKSRAPVWASTAGVALYSGGLLFHAPLLRALEHGREWVLFLLFVTFVSDTCAFLVGRSVGKTPMAPRVSPSKTWEGSTGGLVGALGASLAAVGVADFVGSLEIDLGWGYALALGMTIGIVGQLGDLVESRFKRSAEVKDSGWLIPGHGGVLDRVDSIVLSLVVVYYFVLWGIQ